MFVQMFSEKFYGFKTSKVMNAILVFYPKRASETKNFEKRIK